MAELRFSEEARNAFAVNEEELAGIQGEWRKSEIRQITYTFSGNDFTLAGGVRGDISGTFRINDEKLMLIVNNELFGLYIYEYQSGNILYLHELFGRRDSQWAAFERQ